MSKPRISELTARRDTIILAYMRVNGAITKHDARLLNALRAAGCPVHRNASQQLSHILLRMYERGLVERRRSAPYPDPTWGSYYLQCWEYVLPE